MKYFLKDLEDLEIREEWDVCVCVYKRTQPYCEVLRSLCLLATPIMMSCKETWDAVVQGSLRAFKTLKWRKVMESDEVFRVLPAGLLIFFPNMLHIIFFAE